MRNLETAQTAPRGTGANVHDALRSLLYYLKAEHGFTLEDFARLHACQDSPTRRGDVPEGEVERLVSGLFGRTFTPRPKHSNGAAAPTKIAPTTEDMTHQWLKNAERMMREEAEEGADCERLLRERSAFPIPEKGSHQFSAALGALYRPGERISLVTACTPEGSPVANDRCMSPEEWQRTLSRPNNISGKAGVWWRHNPVSDKGGSGKGGAVRDCDIAAPRYLLLENDVLPRHMQAAILLFLIERRQLPIRCVTDSGGKSLHALVETAPGDYANSASQLLADLHREFGFDKGNVNPSRMSRAPGFVRGIGAKGDGKQRLLFLGSREGAMP
jgi:hypothetical protein